MNGIELLAAAIDQRAREIYDANGDDAAERADAKDLCRALARILSGVTLHAAFGSPGDWGYGTPIGAALAKVYSEQAPANGVTLIAKERERQIVVEGWTPEHDDEHAGNQLAMAAACYASPVPLNAEIEVPCGCREAMCPHSAFGKHMWVPAWPFDAKYDKRGKHDRMRQLVIAGALIVAEIDRLQRKAKDVQ